MALNFLHELSKRNPSKPCRSDVSVGGQTGKPLDKQSYYANNHKPLVLLQPTFNVAKLQIYPYMKPKSYKRNQEMLKILKLILLDKIYKTKIKNKYYTNTMKNKRIN